MENLEKLIYDLYKKNARQCTNEEIYNALLIYTKNQLCESEQNNQLQTKKRSYGNKIKHTYQALQNRIERGAQPKDCRVYA